MDDAVDGEEREVDGVRQRPAGEAGDRPEGAVPRRRRQRQSTARPLLVAALAALGTFAAVFGSLGYFLAGSATWGAYDRVVHGPAAERLRRMQADESETRWFTLEELALHDGSDPARPLLLSIKHTVFDVTAGGRFYGPGKHYSALVGRDATRAYATGCFENERQWDLREMTPDMQDAVDGWLDFYIKSDSYHYVGRLVVPDVAPTDPLPSDKCDATEGTS